MSNEQKPEPKRPTLSLIRNWVSLTGLVVVVGSLFAFLLLVLIDTVARSANPYIGILTYLVTPFFLVMGGLLTLLGLWLARRRRLRHRPQPLSLVLDLGRRRDRRILGGVLLGGILFLFLTAFGSYQSYQFSESVQFCGEVCHKVMQPEFVTYEHGPHARVACVECHIGPGATWFVRSKLSGLYQVYATLFDKYSRPIPTPVTNLRPAQQTCEQCHWPKKFTGNLDKTLTYYLSDRTNTEYSIRLLLKVGGGDPTHGPVGGIHWHMNIANKIEYIATDKRRQHIPWVRVTNRKTGAVTVYRAEGFTNKISKYTIRTMDCMDCHNRPAHVFVPPSDAVNLALELPGRLDPALPWIKSNAVQALTLTYTNDTEALHKIATLFTNFYTNVPTAHLTEQIETVQQIYTNNFFPAMKASWKAYPDNIGHKNWSGCFRCHDGQHHTAGGKRTISHACNTCHTIIAQGRGAQMLDLTPGGQKFKHPTPDYDPSFLCHDCHDGSL